jgi:hypothetical protein
VGAADSGSPITESDREFAVGTAASGAPINEFGISEGTDPVGIAGSGEPDPDGCC